MTGRVLRGVFVWRTPLDSIRHAEKRLKVPEAERLEFVAREGHRMFLSRLIPGAGGRPYRRRIGALLMLWRGLR